MKSSYNQTYLCGMWDIIFQKKKLEWGRNRKIFCSLFVQMKPVEFAFEIKWPLVPSWKRSRVCFSEELWEPDEQA